MRSCISLNYKPWMQLAHTVADENTQIAVQNYESQQRRLLNYLDVDPQISSVFIDTLNQQLLKELQTDGNNIISQKMDEVLGTVKSFIDGTDDNGMSIPDTLLAAIKEQQAKMRTKEGSKTYLTNLYDNTKKAFDAWLASDKVDNKWLAAFNSVTTDRNRAASDIANQLKGYARRLMAQAILENKAEVSTANYKQAMKGYYAEVAITDALQKAFEQYKQSSLTAEGSGTILKVGTNQQEIVDIILFDPSRNKNNKVDLEELIFGAKQRQSGNITLQATGEVDLYDDVFGVQSKSWLQPWLAEEGAKSIYSNGNLNASWLSIGRHGDILNGQEIYSWHENIVFTSQHMAEILGPNVLFGTGAGITWTSQLIQDFSAHNYYLAYYMSVRTHKTTNEVTWQLEQTGSPKSKSKT